MRRRVTISLSFALLVCGVAAAGCGGSSNSETGVTKNPLAGYPEGPTRQFILPGGDNTVQEFGREATPAERAQVSTMVAAWLRARAAKNWGKACSYLHSKVRAFALRTASQASEERSMTCPKALALFSQSGEPPRDNIKDGVASLRIEAGTGYAQYHGKEGRDWILAVRMEDGDWKIADFRPVERLK
jgi:hypothetical protein